MTRRYRIAKTLTAEFLKQDAEKLFRELRKQELVYMRKQKDALNQQKEALNRQVQVLDQWINSIR